MARAGEGNNLALSCLFIVTAAAVRFVERGAEGGAYSEFCQVGLRIVSAGPEALTTCGKSACCMPRPSVLASGHSIKPVPTPEGFASTSAQSLFFRSAVAIWAYNFHSALDDTVIGWDLPPPGLGPAASMNPAGKNRFQLIGAPVRKSKTSVI